LKWNKRNNAPSDNPINLTQAVLFLGEEVRNKNVLLTNLQITMNKMDLHMMTHCDMMKLQADEIYELRTEIEDLKQLINKTKN